MKRCKHLVLIATALFGLALQTAAQPQNFPARPIKIVVPFPPGGGADVVARIAGAKVTLQMGQPVIIENKPGANTIVAAQTVAKSAADGYTLLLAIDTTMVINQHMYRKLPYNPERDFAPVALLSTIPLVLVANPAVPATNLSEFIKFAKSTPQPLHYGAGAITTQLVGELFNKTAGTKLVYVPYKGGSTTITAVLGGEVPLAVDGLSTTLPQYRAGKVRVYGITTARRASIAPDIPTLAEQGLLGFDVSLWQSLVAPAGVPAQILSRLHDEFTKAMQLEDVRKQLAPVGIEVLSMSREGFAEQLRVESAKWGALITEVGIPKLD